MRVGVILLTESTHNNRDTTDETEERKELNLSRLEKGLFPIIGIGASTGGVTALKALFSHFPIETDLEMAFILIQSNPPDNNSLIEKSLEKSTSLKVYEIEDGMKVLPNSIYILPPFHVLEIEEGRLHLRINNRERDLHLPMDSFFKSLALYKKEGAICIILSGEGTYGTLGLKEVKAQGGMTMVQDPDSAENNSMPSSAIKTGLVDYILPPEKMPEHLIHYIKNTYGKEQSWLKVITKKPYNTLQEIFNLLLEETGHSFSGYKQSTIGRRIQRRLALNQIETLDEYLDYLKENRLEIDALFHELLVGVTSFFRDPQAFKALQKKVIPQIFAGKNPENPVRVWVPGCSTGEEAYSIAILLKEYQQRLKKPLKIQVFATDIDSRSIQTGRMGIYPASIVATVSHERLKHFFKREPHRDKYSIQKSIRDMLVFAEQNIVEDPPFSRIDLISCRNLLIFMDIELQKRVLHLFSYALNPEGFLFLGTSESTGDLMDHFISIDRRWKIYQNKGSSIFRPAKSYLPLLNYSSYRNKEKESERVISLGELVEKIVLQEYTPACVVISKRAEILYIHGRTGKYLEPAQGEMSLNILQMAREGLKMELSAAFRKASTQNKPVHIKGLRVKENSRTITINLTVKPLEDYYDYSELLLVVFEDVPEEEEWREETAVTREVLPESKRISLLEKELRDKEEHLQTVIEELETSNEEMQSTNEELQSTNEELETSKEELQSVNEELITVNTELQKKIQELFTTNNDMNNMLSGTGVGTIFVDLLQRIQRFTPPITNVMNLIPSDLGRPVNHISSNLIGHDCLAEDVQEVLDTLVTKEIEVQTRKKEWYLMRILPYHTVENTIKGAVITFTNITKQKKIQSVSRLAIAVKDACNAILLYNLKGEILAWNSSAQRLYGYKEEEALKLHIRDLSPKKDYEEICRLQEREREKKGIEPFQSRRITKDGKLLHVWITLSVLCNQEGEPYGFSSTEKEIGESL